MLKNTPNMQLHRFAYPANKGTIRLTITRAINPDQKIENLRMKWKFV